MNTTITTDPIADMLTRIRNAINVRKSEIALPHSILKEKIAVLLKQSKLISNYEISGEGINKTLKIVLNSEDSSSPITEIDRLSKPGRRVYSKASKMPTVKSGRGLVIVSTSQGLMTGEQARKAGVGGELICKVY